MSMPVIKKMALGDNNYLKDPTITKTLKSVFASPQYDNLKGSCFHRFVDEGMEDDEHYFGSAPFVSFLLNYFSNCDVVEFLTTLF